MKRLGLIGAVVVGLVALAVWLWPTASIDPPPHQPSSAHPEVPDFERLSVQAQGAAQGLTLTGVVYDAKGTVVSGAEVSLAASAQLSLPDVKCGTCSQGLLSCHSEETARHVATTLAGGRGALHAAATTTSGPDGAFKFERLAGVSFTVWARAPGLGEGLRERAAPGDPVSLYLPAPRTLSGRLRDERGNPVRGTVRATSRRLAHFASSDTDAEGRFALAGLGEGPFYVSATAPGFLPAWNPQAAAGPRDVVLTLKTPRALEVRLLADGKAVDGQVRLVRDHLDRRVPIQGGLGTIDALYPGELVVTAASGELSSAPQVVSLTGDLTRVTITLERGGRIAVSVVDEAGQPVPTPRLELLTPTGELVTTRSLKTGELGLLGPYGPGDYLLRASADRFEPQVVPVALKTGELPVEVTLQQGTIISGQVIDEYGRPAPGVSVLITPTGDNVIAGDDGRFVAPVPSPGFYSLHAHHSDWGGGELKVTAPARDVVLQLEPKAGVEVTVLVDGRRVEAANAVLFTSEGNFRNDRPSGADGVVVMRGLPPNTYALVASHPDFLPSDRQTVTLEDGRLVKVDAQLKSGAPVKGQVVDTLGAPVSGVSVFVVPRGAEPAVTDAAGNFTITPLRAEGLYAIRVADRGLEQADRVLARAGGEAVRVVVKRQTVFRGRVLGNGAPLKRFRVDEHEVTSADGRFELPLPASEDRVVVMIEAPGFEPVMENRPVTPDLGDFNLERAPQVTGVVRDEGGQPVADAVVTCDTCERSTLSEASGRFTLSRPAFQREFIVIAKKGRRSATRTVVAEASVGLELVIKSGVRLIGRAALPNGQPAAGVEIAGVHVDRSEPVSVVTGADGAYEMEVPEGVYRLMLAAPGFQNQAADPPATIAEVKGPETRVDFGPVPGLATLSVKVTPTPMHALWLVRGDVRQVGNPPLELLRSSYAQLIFQPRVDRVQFGALVPGRYTLIWGVFHAETPGGLVVVPVDVLGPTEATLVR